MEQQPDAQKPAHDAQGQFSVDAEALSGRVAEIELQPLDTRAAGFDALHDELLAELQRSDQERA